MALIVNPLAGRGHALRSLPVVEDYLRVKGLAYEVFQRSYPASLDAFTDLLILGGDGTVNHLLNHFPDIRIPIGVIPAGSGNDLAVLLAGSRDILRCIETAVYGNMRWLDAGRCNGQIFMNCLGVGFDGEVASDIARVRWLGGSLQYYYTVILKIFRYRSAVMKAVWDGGEFEARALTVMAANSQFSGGGFRVAPMADIADGKLDIVIIGDIPLLQRLFYLPRIRSGTHVSLPFVQTARFTRLNIEVDTPLQAHIDGEPLLAKVYRIEVLPGQFLFRVSDALDAGNIPVH